MKQFAIFMTILSFCAVGKVGKEASAGTASLKVGSDVAFFVMANSATETVSGIVKCDKATKKMAVASLGWSNSKTKVSGVQGGGL